MKKSLILIMILGVFAWSCKNKKEEQVSSEQEMESETTESNSDDINLSLAEWSLHKALFAEEMNNLDFAGEAAKMGFTGIEYVNQFFKDKAEDKAYLDQMNEIANKAGVKQLLIMVDGEGFLGDLNEEKRNEAVENHKKWVDAAEYLGCHSIRVNAHGEGSAEEVAAAAIDGLGKISQYAATKGINVLVENHGGYSSNGEWLTGVMQKVNMDNCGTLPDFGNFCLKREEGAMYGAPCIEEYDKYQGVKELMNYAKAVSAKSNNFDENGDEIDIDYDRMIDIVKASGYNGFIGVEYEGSELSEKEGIMKTKELLIRVWNKKS